MARLIIGLLVVLALATCLGYVFWQSLPSNAQMGLPPAGTGPMTPLSGPGVAGSESGL